MNRRRVLVTGGAGFIGSHLVERLLVEGHEVICVDNFSSGTKHNLQTLAQHPFLDVIRHDVVQPLSLEVDEIYHLACPASPKQYQENPVKTLETCMLGTLNSVTLAKTLGCKMLLASTSEVYGDPQVHPQEESYWGHVNPIGPRSCYDEGKRVAETLCTDYSRQYGLDIRIIRIFNTYGPRMKSDDGRVISNFITQALAHSPVTLYGDGQQTRSFCYVTDLIDGIMSVMKHDAPLTQPINLGNPEEISILALANRIIEKTHSRSIIEHGQQPQDDPRRRCPNINRAKALLNWQPYTDLSLGLDRTIEYFRHAMVAQPNDSLEVTSAASIVTQP